jgi:hypothetical protein
MAMAAVACSDTGSAGAGGDSGTSDDATDVRIPGDVASDPRSCGDCSMPDPVVRLGPYVFYCDPSTPLRATVCNLGNAAASPRLPVAFYAGARADPSNLLCVAYTDGPLPVCNECLPVACKVSMIRAVPPEGPVVTAVVNDDGMGGHTEMECTVDDDSDTAPLFCEGPH